MGGEEGWGKEKGGLGAQLCAVAVGEKSALKSLLAEEVRWRRRRGDWGVCRAQRGSGGRGKMAYRGKRSGECAGRNACLHLPPLGAGVLLVVHVAHALLHCESFSASGLIDVGHGAEWSAVLLTSAVIAPRARKGGGGKEGGEKGGGRRGGHACMQAFRCNAKAGLVSAVRLDGRWDEKSEGMSCRGLWIVAGQRRVKGKKRRGGKEEKTARKDDLDLRPHLDMTDCFVDDVCGATAIAIQREKRWERCNVAE